MVENIIRELFCIYFCVKLLLLNIQFIYFIDYEVSSVQYYINNRIRIINHIIIINSSTHLAGIFNYFFFV